ncbi:MAG: recombinase family protein [Vallitaleaceae bacterium]|nr:recombinase family protein [Vallitaleaceae bacterium]
MAMAKKNAGYDAPSAVAVIYARYSSHAQKDVSIEQQVEECKEYAQANNMEVASVYSDRAITGKSDKRPEFQKMIRHAEKQQFQVIIAYKSNRIARNMLQALAYEDKLAKYGIRVVYVKEEFGDNAAGRFALRTMMNVNQFYSENMAEDIRRGLNDNAMNCKITNGGLPLGYKKGEDGRYELVEAEAEVVREIFSRTACGEPFADIAADLNDRGIKTSRGNTWGKNSFHAILNNERYTGVYIYEKVRIEGGVPQIIGKELFYSVQEKLKTKKNPQGRHRVNGDYLLTGKLYCGKCKSHMVGMSGTGKLGKLHYYYACQRKRIEKSCNKENVRRDWIEEQVAAAIRQYLLKDDVIEWIADSVHEYGKKRKNQSEIGVLESQLAENKKATKNLLAAIEQGIITPTTKERLLELEAEQSRIASRISIEKAEVPEVAKDDVIAWLESFRDGEVTDKKYQAKLFDTFLIAVYLYDNKLKIAFNFSGKKNTISVPLDASVVDNIENDSTAGCSYKVSLEPPYGFFVRHYQGYGLHP